MSIEIIPDGRARNPTGAVREPLFGGAYAVKVHCVSCGKPGGWVPQKYTTRAFYICNDCLPKYADKLGPNEMVFPDEVFWDLVAKEQIEKYGRPLTSEETGASLKDPNSLESKLARERKLLTPGNHEPGR